VAAKVSAVANDLFEAARAAFFSAGEPAVIKIPADTPETVLRKTSSAEGDLTATLQSATGTKKHLRTLIHA
jgi:hypothetical protein